MNQEVDGKEFDICPDCWRPLEQKLKGKGRMKRKRETVLLPPRSVPEGEPEEPRPAPRVPPKIFGETERTN